MRRVVPPIGRAALGIVDLEPLRRAASADREALRRAHGSRCRAPSHRLPWRSRSGRRRAGGRASGSASSAWRSSGCSAASGSAAARSIRSTSTPTGRSASATATSPARVASERCRPVPAGRDEQRATALVMVDLDPLFRRLTSSRDDRARHPAPQSRSARRDWPAASPVAISQTAGRAGAVASGEASQIIAACYSIGPGNDSAIQLSGRRR